MPTPFAPLASRIEQGGVAKRSQENENNAQTRRSTIGDGDAHDAPREPEEPEEQPIEIDDLAASKMRMYYIGQDDGRAQREVWAGKPPPCSMSHTATLLLTGAYLTPGVTPQRTPHGASAASNP